MKTTDKEVRFIAVDGAKTERGATIQASILPDDGSHIRNKKYILEGDIATYANGDVATVLKDESTRCKKYIGNQTYFIAAEGTPLSNGDIIIDAGQYSVGLIKQHSTINLGIITDEESQQILKQRHSLCE